MYVSCVCLYVMYLCMYVMRVCVRYARMYVNHAIMYVGLCINFDVCMLYISVGCVCMLCSVHVCHVCYE